MQFMLKSETIAWQNGGKKAVPLDFLERIGPRTGRFTIERIHVEMALNITTPAAVSILGADQAGFAKKLRVYDTIGNRFYLTGGKSRVVMHLEMQDAVPNDPATHAASTTQTDTFNMFINFSQPKTSKREFDYSLPVDDLLNGGGIEVEFPVVSDILSTGGAITSINSGTYTFTFFLREEWDVEFHVRDVREEFTTSVATAWYLPVSGRLVRYGFAYKELAGGGTATTTITDLTIEPYKIVAATRNSQLQGYLARADVNQPQDPFFNSKAHCFLWPRVNAKWSDFLLFGGQLLIKANSTMALPDLVGCFLAPKDERMMRAAAAMNGVDGSNQRVKTFGKTAGDPALWGKLAPFVSIKVPRPGLGG